MNNKGQMDGLGTFMVIFITVLVGLVLFQSIAQQVGSSTTLDVLTNFSITPGATGTVNTITGYKLLTTPTVRNASGLIPATNYTIADNQVVDGTLVATITTNAGTLNGTTWNVSAVSAQPDTYISDSAGRSLASLIAIFFALAIVVVAMAPTLRSGLLEGVKN